MTEYEIARLVDRLTGLGAATLALGLIIGYIRVLTSDSLLVRHLSTSTVLLAVACATETLRVRDTGSVDVQMLGIAFNLIVAYAHFRGLQAIHRMIPEHDRQYWNWLSAPLYPPWGWTLGLHKFFRRWQREIRLRDRRQQQQPIEFPDRRTRRREDGGDQT